ncbi:uncharacterized protein LOC117651824 [Thrips palmi]|uniref:Uncharacterized protein LOC117651824 n=1 Tax=Thrips palmi TaxID=161013 RepID=A0A6P9A2S1_THRPL|nr:uncharacterized protein LOC117651824 [Thrips palmi]
MDIMDIENSGNSPITSAKSGKLRQGGKVCCVSHCGNKSALRTTSLHQVPLDGRLRKLWLDACKIDDPRRIFCKYLFVCGEHFSATDFSGTPTKRRLKKVAVPSKNLHIEPEQRVKDVCRKNCIVCGRFLSSPRAPLKTTSNICHDHCVKNLRSVRKKGNLQPPQEAEPVENVAPECETVRDNKEPSEAEPVDNVVLDCDTVRDNKELSEAQPVENVVMPDNEKLSKALALWDSVNRYVVNRLKEKPELFAPAVLKFCKGFESAKNISESLLLSSLSNFNKTYSYKNKRYIIVKKDELPKLKVAFGGKKRVPRFLNRPRATLQQSMDVCKRPQAD